jgi:hypothetical protein
LTAVIVRYKTGLVAEDFNPVPDVARMMWISSRNNTGTDCHQGTNKSEEVHCGGRAIFAMMVELSVLCQSSV